MARLAGFSLLAFASCGGAERDPGLDLWVRIPGAQLVRQEVPEDGGGPAVTFLDLRTLELVGGRAGTPVSGRVQSGAMAMHVGFEGDAGHWVFPVGLPDPAVPAELDWEASMDVSRDLPLGPMTLLVAAVDARGRAGARVRGDLRGIDDAPHGELVVGLEWDAQADVDLLVTDPQGVQIGPKNINSYQAPGVGEPPDEPDAWRQGGILDIDSNSGCIIDGIRREHVVWAEPPPEGRYVVHVAMTRPCGQPRASFRVVARTPDGVIARSEGVLYEIDARTPGGVRALEFTL